MSSSSYLCGRGQRRVCALCYVPWPFSQLPAPSVAGLIGVTAGQAVVTATRLFSIVIAGGGERRFATSDERSSSGQSRGVGTHLWIIITLINTLSLQMLTPLLLSDARSFCEWIYILFCLGACLHTYSDRVVTRSGHCSALSDSTSLSVSLIWPETTPLPVRARVHVCNLAVSPRSSRKAETLKNTQLSAVSLYGHC